jgi:spermidine synthase
MTEIVEPLADGLSRVWRLDEVLVDTHTAYQHVVIARTAQGVSLFCDNDRQSTEASQLVYHEALLVPALLLAERLDRVLVIGSSEGVVCQLAGAAGAVVDHVDIDREAVELCARYLPYGYSPDELTGVRFADGWEFVAQCTDRYDVIVVDLPDEHPDGAQHNRLYQAEFLLRCKGLLTPGGVLATQAGCPTLWRNGTLVQSWQRFHEVFGTVAYYGSDEQEWAFLFGLASPVADPVARMLERLPTLPYRPVTIDRDALRGNTIPPRSVRLIATG